jgi:hypothetical protein
VYVGGAMAKFAGINVHKRLVAEDAYRQKRYEEALKNAFLGTDKDFLASGFHSFLPATSKYTTAIEHPDTGGSGGSPGCTATAALITGDGKIYIVCGILFHHNGVKYLTSLNPFIRQMQATQEQSLASKAKLRRSVSTTYLQIRVRLIIPI